MCGSLLLMSDIRELYQEMILEHQKKPRNYQVLEDANRRAEGFNPLCGDRITVYLNVEDDLIKDVAFQGSGCAISKASASLMTVSVKGKKIEEAIALFEGFHQMLSGDPGSPARAEKLGKLAVFSGVCDYPVRVKCATLAWHTLKGCLSGEDKTVSTE